MTLLAVAAMLAWSGAQQSASGEPVGAPARAAGGCNRAAFRVVVDVGHTVQAPGARSARGIYEFVFNLSLARRIREQLVAAGFGRTVQLVTDGPAQRSLFERVGRANRLAPDLFLSIHHDSVPDMFLEKWEFDEEERSFSDRFNGHSIFVSRDNGDPGGSLGFARQLGHQLKARGLQYTPHYTDKIMGNRQRLLVDAGAGVYRYDQLIVLRHTTMPAALFEAGSIINRDEELRLGSSEHQGLIAAAATDAVDGFCATRRPRSPPVAAGRPGGALAQPTRASAATLPAKPAGQR